ncbi:Uncharacterised protein [uncultured archaeon]|nr:Uncharacterised protein [uncultured archaeon]
MPVLGIIACRSLEDELAHVLSEDNELRQLIIIDNKACFDLSRKLRSKNRPHLIAAWEEIPEMLKDIRRTGPGILKPLLERSRHLCGLLGKAGDAGEEVIIVVNVLKIALNIDNKILKAYLSKNIQRMSQFSDSILLFYGRCGNALQDIETPQGRHCPLFFLTDGSGERVDDCIAATLGGNRQYGEALSSNQGVGYFCTPMQASSLDYTDREVRRYTIEHHLKPKSFGDILVELGYSKIAMLDTGLKFISDFEVESTINGFASLYHLKVVKLRGSVEIAERCYRQAKDDVIHSA